MKLKAWKVANDDGYGIIVFAETRGKARQLAIGKVEIMMGYEWCELFVTREPRADKYSDNEPSYLEFCENAVAYKNLGWECYDIDRCNLTKCVLHNSEGREMKFCDKCEYLEPKEHEQKSGRVPHKCTLDNKILKHYIYHPQIPTPSWCRRVER